MPVDVRDGLGPTWRSALLRLTASTLALQLAKEILGADQMIVEDPPRGVEEFRNQRIAYGVPHDHTFLAAGHDVIGPQDRQLLRDDGLLHAKRVFQLLDVLLALDQQLENPNSNGVSERPEERSLERLEVVGDGDVSHVVAFYLLEEGALVSIGIHRGQRTYRRRRMW